MFAIGIATDSSSAFRGGITQLHVDYSLVAGFPRTDIGVAEGEWYRMITSGFLHYGVIHLLFNMYALWLLGGAVEQMGGRGRMAATYGLSVLCGALGALIVTPDAFTAGASGGVFGLMGAILVAQRIQGVAFRDSPLIGILFLNLVFTFGISNISVGGHIGGLVGGALAGWALFSPTLRRQSPSLGYALCAGAGLACLVGGLSVAAAAV